jgi:putative transposase
MKCAWIKQHAADSCVNRLCRLLDVSRSSYYAWLNRSPTPTEKTDQALTAITASAFKKSRATYRTRRLKKVLSQQDREVSRRRIGHLMRDAKLACKTRRRFKATTNSKHNHPIAENNLDRQFKVHQPSRVYVGDITYIYTQEGWSYLAVVIDLFSRQIVDWSMAEHIPTGHKCELSG